MPFSEGRVPCFGLGSLLEKQHLLRLQRSEQADKAFSLKKQVSPCCAPPPHRYVVGMLHPWVVIFNSIRNPVA